MLTFFDRFTKSKEPAFFPDTLWPIVVAYAQDDMVDMMYFCASLGWKNTLKTLQEKDKQEMQACAQQTQNLLAKAKETADIISASEAKIDVSNATIKRTQGLLLDQTIKRDHEIAHGEFTVKTSQLVDKIAALQMELKASELELNLTLADQKQEAERQANVTLEAALKKEYEEGSAVSERQVQAQAKFALEQAQRELANGSAYFQQVHRMIQNLKKFPLHIDAEKANKKQWSNPVRMLTLEEFRARVGVVNVFDGIYEATASVILIGAIVGVILSVSLLVTLFPMPTDIILVPFITAIAIGVVVGAITTVLLCCVRIECWEGPQRFEAHILSRSFSRDLVAKFREIQTKIAGFQVINNAIDQPEVEHPVLQLKINTATVSDIRKAMARELPFFQRVYAQLPKYQEQELVNAELPAATMG